MYQIKPTKTFRKSIKRLKKSGMRSAFEKNLTEVLDDLILGSLLPAKYRDHQLSGSLKDYRECHLKPDLLLVYQIDQKIKTVILVDIGSHAQIFG